MGNSTPVSGSSRLEVDLGQACPCLNVADINKSVSFYSSIGFKLAGGDVSLGWAVMHNPATELHLFQGHITDDLLNFRGRDVFEVEAELKQRGFEFAKPAEVENDGSAGADLKDPAGFDIYFNSTDEEIRRYAAIQETASGQDSTAARFGQFVWALVVADAEQCLEFYERLGFAKCYEYSGEDGKWFELEIPGNPGMKLALCEKLSPGRMLMFVGGDVYAIEKQLVANGLAMDIPAQKGFDGVDSMMLRDPDGNMVCFHGPQPED